MKNLHLDITQTAIKKYALSIEIDALSTGKEVLNYSFVKKISHKINSKREKTKSTFPAMQSSILQAMILMDKIIHHIINTYQAQIGINNWVKVVGKTKVTVGEESINALLDNVKQQYPLLSKEPIDKLVKLNVQNQNPAFNSLKDLIESIEVKNSPDYSPAIKELQNRLKTMPVLAQTELSLFETLLTPIKKYPESVFEQLKFLQKTWPDLIQPFQSEILISLDYIKEEYNHYDPDAFANPKIELPNYSGEEFEPEAFSDDLDWMPHLVLIAKSSYVWLDQLSKQYQSEINTLDKIPDSELDRLQQFGVTGLWLIGLWERSTASRSIKQINGNPEAVASAYALKNYDIAQDLGGYAAYLNLKNRAAKRGIRLASDMVPNHMAIDSEWVMKHPHWFLQRRDNPFPNHTYNGPELANDANTEIFIEDGYYSKSDAAVCFKRVDRNTGRVAYIYHGNDGTGMPWNDTAQLNYLNAEVREAVIQTILHVARMFPVIRFDAAMTLAKKHYQRLWFPQPGTGGDIPTRSEYAMTKPEFDACFPAEFWREVVDRVQQECPDTLLLAEAFWMMESYFVRSLGMHRVYNSAFMHMLKKEDNAQYRLMIRQILEYNPEILKRYVNFMNNPDEETAVAQFGKDNKYFGVCLLMSTLPGLPMFGHGQIEGYAEKYGMEYKKAYWDENVDTDLVERHKHDIFPLLKMRKQFSEVQNFRFYNFETASSGVNENVFAYSNYYHSDAHLIIYNNVYESSAGFVKHAVGYKGNGADLIHTSLVEGLKLNTSENAYSIFKDSISGKSYIRKNSVLAEKGLFVQLSGYAYQVFIAVKNVYDTPEMPYAQLDKMLDGKAVSSVEEELQAIRINKETQKIAAALELCLKSKSKKNSLKRVELLKNELFNKYNWPKSTMLLKDITQQLSGLEALRLLYKQKRMQQKTLLPLSSVLATDNENLNIKVDILSVIVILNYIADSKDAYKRFLQTDRIFKKMFTEKSLPWGAPLHYNTLALEWSVLFKKNIKKYKIGNLFKNNNINKCLKVNSHKGITYFNKERWQNLLGYILFLSISNALSSKKLLIADLRFFIERYTQLTDAAEKCGYNLQKLKSEILVL